MGYLIVIIRKFCHFDTPPDALHLLTREPREICLAFRVQKVWWCEYVDWGKVTIKWPFLSVTACTNSQGRPPK